MQRRALLSAIAAGGVTLAGCSSGGPDETTTRTTPANTTRTTNTTMDDTPTPPEREIGAASVVDFETGDRTASLFPIQRHLNRGIEVATWFRATATPEHPARVLAVLRNENDYTANLDLESIPPLGPRPFSHPHYGDEPGLYLVPTDAHEFARAVPEIERRDDGFWHLAEEPSDWQPKTLDLPPGETAVAHLALVAHYEYAGIPAGRYVFGHGDNPLTVSVWQTSQPGPTETSKFTGVSIPDLPDSDPRFYHEADRSSPTFLRPNPEQADLPETVEFTLVNHAHQRMQGNWYNWSLYKLVDSSWYYLTPYAIPVPITYLRPGDVHEWTLQLFNGEPAQCDCARPIGFLGGGRYAFHVSMSTKDGPSHAALFDLRGDPVTLKPTEDVTSSREGATVTVTSPRYSETDETTQQATLTLTRVDTADETMIAEQVMRDRYRGLRNTLSFFDSDVEKVVLRTDEHVADRSTGQEGQTLRFRFRGQGYEAVANVGSDGG